MSDSTTATVAVIPEPAANDGLTDEALAAIFGDEDAAAAESGDGTAAPEEKPEDAEGEVKPEAETVPEGEAPPVIDLSKLDDAAIEPSAKVESTVEPVSALTKKITEYIPNEEVLGMVVGSHQRLTALEGSLQKGDLGGVYNVLGDRGLNALLDAVYSNEQLRNAFVDRVIEESTGVKKDPQVQALSAKVDELQNFINSGRQQQQTERQQADRQHRAQALTSSIDGLFDAVQFPKDDRHANQRQLMTDALMTRLAKAGKLDAALKGDVRVVRTELKPLLEAFVTAEKTSTAKVESRRAQLEQKPKVVQPGAGGSAAAIAGDGELDIFQQAANEVQRLRKKGK